MDRHTGTPTDWRTRILVLQHQARQMLRRKANAKIAAGEKTIWAEDPASLRGQPRIDPSSWPGAVQDELIRFGDSADLRTPTAAGPAYTAAAVVMMVKDEGDIIGENLTWLHHIGVRRFVILDNDSEDDTADIVRRFRALHRDVEAIVVDDPLLRYMQAEKTTGLYRFACSIWPDVRWVIPVDADEFLIAERGIGVLDAVARRTHAIAVPKVIHFRTGSTAAPGGTVMGEMAYRNLMFRVPPKVIVRPHPLAGIKQGNHQIHFADLRPARHEGGFSHGLYYREFPNRSFDHFLRKVRNGGRAIAAAEAYLGSKIGGWHWVVYHEMLMTQGEQSLLDLYNRDYVRPVSGDLVHDPFMVDASALKPSA